VKPGRYRQPATPADLAPTLASTIDLKLPDAEGVAQTVAFRRW
jgi:hypothetical protein